MAVMSSLTLWNTPRRHSAERFNLRRGQRPKRVLYPASRLCMTVRWLAAAECIVTQRIVIV